MIPMSANLRVWLATGATDMRNYAEHRIMRSPLWHSRAYVIDINVLTLIYRALRSA